MIDIDTTWGKVPVRGNFGVQAVHTKQAASGWQYRGNEDNVDFDLLVPKYGETSYTDFLPSLNLVGEIDSSTLVRFGLAKTLSAVKNIRGVRKQHMVHNSYLPKMEIDAQTYSVRADGQLLTCEAAVSLPMTQRYFLF